MGYASVFSHVGLRSYDQSAAAQTATVSVGLRASLADNRSPWTLEELVSRPLRASYYTKMGISTAVIARDSRSYFPSGSGFENPTVATNHVKGASYAQADREFQLPRGVAPGDCRRCPMN
jgi:hypothetical protein